MALLKRHPPSQVETRRDRACGRDPRRRFGFRAIETLFERTDVARHYRASGARNSWFLRHCGVAAVRRSTTGLVVRAHGRGAAGRSSFAGAMPRPPMQQRPRGRRFDGAPSRNGAFIGRRAAHVPRASRRAGSRRAGKRIVDALAVRKCSVRLHEATARSQATGSSFAQGENRPRHAKPSARAKRREYGIATTTDR
jgi:hypothetical protein